MVCANSAAACSRMRCTGAVSPTRAHAGARRRVWARLEGSGCVMEAVEQNRNDSASRFCSLAGSVRCVTQREAWGHGMNVLSRTLTTALLLAASPAVGQTQLQQDRLDRVAQYVVTAPACGRLGMTLDPDLPSKAAAAIKSETASWRVDPATIDQLATEAVKRQTKMFGTDLETAADNAKSDAQLRAVKGILLGYGRTCVAATTDPIFATLIVPPPGYDLENAATAAADSMLEGGGLASWQTPQIQARGDLMMLAGTCRSKIGPARSDALVKEFGKSDDPRVRNYYSRSFDEGLSDPTTISTLAGCNRAITGFRAKAR